MKKIFLISTVLITILLTSCNNNDDNLIEGNTSILSTWIFSEENNNSDYITYSRVPELPENKYAITFKKDGKFIERTSGWCGTPPLTFFDEEGTWTLKNDTLSIYRIENHYMGNQEFIVEQITDSKLQLKPIENITIEGTWVCNEDDVTCTTFQKSDSLTNEKEGFIFEPDGKFIHRTDCGICEPGDYIDEEGTWEINGNILKIRYNDHHIANPYLNIREYEISKLSSNILKLNRRETSGEKLIKLKNEIESLSRSVTCDGNIDDWTFTPIGEKPCGGPIDYIGYHKNMNNVEGFLAKIEEYTQLQITVNAELGLISDCTINNPPTKMECENGVVKLIYLYP